MAYFSSLFSPQTYEAFKHSDRTISGVRERQHNAAQKVQSGDKLLCYLTGLSRWFGMLEVAEGPFIDRTPIFQPDDDPFVVRFSVRPLVLLEAEKAVPIYEDELWTALSFTRDHAKNTSIWTGKLRSSLVAIDDADGQLIERLLLRQAEGGPTFPVDLEQYRRLTTYTAHRADRDVVVTVPAEPIDAEVAGPPSSARESHRVQALLADIGSRMGMSVWISRGDRAAVAGERALKEGAVVDRLPLNYDQTTLTTIENIDVLWLHGRSIVRAFEVEHTTAVYSGLLRMADLLALQPNMDIKLHIVAPNDKREKVFQEIRRPVFSLLEYGPLAERCTYLSYESIRELAAQPNLGHMKDSVIDEYVEEAE